MSEADGAHSGDKDALIAGESRLLRRNNVRE